MLLETFGAILGAALLSDDDAFGYGESTKADMPRSPGAFGVRGPTPSWRDSNPRYGERGSGSCGCRSSGHSYGADATRTRLDPSSFQQHHEKAAAEFINLAVARGRFIVADDSGRFIRSGGPGRSIVVMSGGVPSSIERARLGDLQERYQVGVSFTANSGDDQSTLTISSR